MAPPTNLPVADGVPTDVLPHNLPGGLTAAGSFVTVEKLALWRTTLKIYRGDHDKAARALGIETAMLKRMVPRV